MMQEDIDNLAHYIEPYEGNPIIVDIRIVVEGITGRIELYVNDWGWNMEKFYSGLYKALAVVQIERVEAVHLHNVKLIPECFN